jgi:hypothetical protein
MNYNFPAHPDCNMIHLISKSGRSDDGRLLRAVHSAGGISALRGIEACRDGDLTAHPLCSDVQVGSEGETPWFGQLRLLFCLNLNGKIRQLAFVHWYWDLTPDNHPEHGAKVVGMWPLCGVCAAPVKDPKHHYGVIDVSEIKDTVHMIPNFDDKYDGQLGGGAKAFAVNDSLFPQNCDFD